MEIGEHHINRAEAIPWRDEKVCVLIDGDNGSPGTNLLIHVPEGLLHTIRIIELGPVSGGTNSGCLKSPDSGCPDSDDMFSL